jgi:hypothetical protein
MSRLPTPGSDAGSWGDILNDYLSQSLKADGTLKANSVDGASIADGAISSAKLDTSMNSILASAQGAVQSINGQSGSNVVLTPADLSAVAVDQIGVSSGIATLDGTGVLSSQQIPAVVEKTTDLGKPSHAVPHVADYTALRAFEPSVNAQTVYMGAIPSEGMFRYDAFDTTAVDDGGRIIVTTGGKRWKRLMSSGTEVRPEWWGANPNGTTNSTAGFVAAIAALGTKGGTVRCSAGTYMVDGGQIVLPALITLEGPGGFSRYNSTYGNVLASSRLVRRLGSDTADLVTVAGSGSGVRNLHIEGRTDSAGTVLVMQGFESTLDEVRIIASAGIGLDIQKANNTRWRNIYVNSCGSLTLPAVKIWSKSGTGEAADTNTLHVDGLTIEGATAGAMEIGVGGTSSLGEYRAEFVTIHRLHIEAPTDVGVSLVKLGNVRHIDFVAPFIVGGNGYLIEHAELASHPYGSGGVRIIGGSLVGQNPATVGTTPYLVKLRTGNDFAMIGTKCARYGSSAIAVDATYGAKVIIDSSCSFDGPGTDLFDVRSARTQLVARGKLRVEGHISVAGSAPSVVWASGISGTSLAGGSNDSAGQLLFGTTASPPGAGILATVTFNTAYTNPVMVMLTPASSTAEALGLWVATTNAGFTVRCANAPSPSAGAGSYQLQYHVIGLGD